MRKVAVLGSGLVVAGTAALMGAGVALSQPSVFLFFHKLSGLVQGLVDEHKKATSFKNKDSPSPRMGTLAEDEA